MRYVQNGVPMTKVIGPQLDWRLMVESVHPKHASADLDMGAHVIHTIPVQEKTLMRKIHYKIVKVTHILAHPDIGRHPHPT